MGGKLQPGFSYVCLLPYRTQNTIHSVIEVSCHYIFVFCFINCRRWIVFLNCFIHFKKWERWGQCVPCREEEFIHMLTEKSTKLLEPLNSTQKMRTRPSSTLNQTFHSPSCRTLLNTFEMTKKYTFFTVLEVFIDENSNKHLLNRAPGGSQSTLLIS